MSFAKASEIDLVASIWGGLSLLGGIYLVRSILGSSAEAIANQCSTWMDSNRFVQEALVTQKVETQMGFWMTTCGAFVGFLGAFVKVSIPISGWWGVSPGICILLVGILAELWVRKNKTTLKEKVSLILFAKFFATVIKPDDYRYKIEQAADYAKTLDLEHLIVEIPDPFAKVTELLKRAERPDLIERVQIIQKKMQ